MLLTLRFATCRTAVACNSNIRIYRYAVGQRFGKHIDESVEDENGHHSQWTVLIYLNGEREGGEGGGAASAGGSLEKSRGGSGAVAGWSAGAAAGSGVGPGEEGAPLRGGETVFYKARQKLLALCVVSDVQHTARRACLGCGLTSSLALGLYRGRGLLLSCAHAPTQQFQVPYACPSRGVGTYSIRVVYWYYL